MLRSSIVVVVAGLALAFASSSFAADKEKSEKAGGVAAEHRSEKATENANSQWEEGAEKGQARAEERAKSAEEATSAETSKAAEKGKAAEKSASSEKKKSVDKAKAKTPDVATAPTHHKKAKKAQTKEQ